MIRPRVAAYAVLALVAAWLFWPRDRDTAGDQARENGYRAARSAIYHRQLAAVAMDSLVSARLATDRVVRDSRTTLRNLRTVRFDTLPVTVDTQPSRVIVGPHTPTDTLVALPLVRAQMQMLVDTAQYVISSIEALVQIERGRASLAIQHLERTIVAQDTVIASLKVVLKAKSPPWYRRGPAGVVHAVAGGSCAGAGWLLGGPLAGVGAGLTCSFVAGVFR